MGDDGTTKGVYFNEREQEGLLADFDERYGKDNGGPGRSAAMKEAMELKLAVDDVLDDTGYDLDERGKRMFVRQALLDHWRREQADDA